jgi:hypothetical protein
MKRIISRSVACAIFIILLSFTSISAGVIRGTIYDIQTGEPIPGATVRVEATEKSMLANQAGEFRIRLENGSYILKFSHIAYQSDTITVNTSDSAMTIDIRLKPALHLIKGMKVYERAYDPAQRIIIEAIARKEKLLARLRSYSFNAYTKFVVRNAKKPDSINVMMITETQLESFWEPPDKHKEIITARRQTSNIEGEMNVFGMGQIIDFNENRIELGFASLVSPTAKDALDHYNYYLIDTVYYDNHPVFRLEIEPRSQSTPLFIGTIDIVDSSFAIVGVDVTFNKAVDTYIIKNFRYAQSCSKFKEDLWMPVEAHSTGVVDLPFPFNLTLSFNMTAAMHNYNIDIKHPEDRFDEFIYEIAEKADDIDSITWDSGQIIPLTAEEIKNYQRIDSIVKAPKPFWHYLLEGGIGVVVLTTFAYDFFHFNRTEGAYLGIANEFEDIFPGLNLSLKSGWSFKGEFWQNRVGFNYAISKRHETKLGFEYRDEIQKRPTIVSRKDGNPTVPSLFNKTDPYDYYLEKGFNIDLTSRLFSYRTEISASYNDYLQYSVPNATEYCIFKTDKLHRPNPAIDDGHLRSLSIGLKWRTVDLIKNKKEIERIETFPYTSISIGVEKASPDLIDNDFDFSRYSVRLYHSRRLFGLGVSEIDLYAGTSEGRLPRQKYFIVDCAAGVFHEGLAFKTMAEINFIGDRALMAYFHHDFERLFLKSGIPLIEKIPLSVSAHGGVFWTDFRHSTPNLNGDMRFAGRPYREIGFGIGGITPYRFGCMFTWQLSDYPTNRFTWLIGIGM